MSSTGGFGSSQPSLRSGSTPGSVSVSSTDKNNVIEDLINRISFVVEKVGELSWKPDVSSIDVSSCESRPALLGPVTKLKSVLIDTISTNFSKAVTEIPDGIVSKNLAQIVSLTIEIKSSKATG